MIAPPSVTSSLDRHTASLTGGWAASVTSHTTLTSWLKIANGRRRRRAGAVLARPVSIWASCRPYWSESRAVCWCRRTRTEVPATRSCASGALESDGAASDAMRLPRARAESGERTVETAPAAAVASQRVLTPLTNSSDLVLPAFSSVESLNSGLTRTTPTLTPTTLRNIEETFMAFDRGLVAPPVSHQHQAGFVTPQVAAGGGSFAAAAEPHQLYAARRAGASPAPAACGQLPSQSPSPPADLTPRAVPQGHHRGGRRPKDDDELSPEEEQRRRVRRERNKQAAARCRRRRLDLTNTLQMETEELEDERSSLEREIQMLTAQKEELNFLLEAHRPCCKLGRDKENAPKRRVIVKQEPAKIARTEAPLEPPPPPPAVSSSAAQPITKVPRPTTLSVAGFATATNMHKDVPISTPSQGLGLNFDSLLQGGTGLTPISSTALPPLMPLTSGSLATPVVSQPDRRADMLSPETGKELVSL